MALISNVAAAIAQAEGLPEASVQLAARYIREAGLLSTGARGRNAPSATIQDCANLLIAVNGAGCAVKDAPQAVTQFRNLVMHAPMGTELESEFRFMDRNATSTFAEILEGIIDRFISGELPDFFFGRALDYIPQDKFGSAAEAFEAGGIGAATPLIDGISRAVDTHITVFRSVALTIEFRRPNPSAVILVDRINKGGIREVLAGANFIMDSDDARSFKRSEGDMHESRSIGYRTLSAIAKAMKN